MIVQGDHGTKIKIVFLEYGTPVDLTNAKIELNVKHEERCIQKEATVTGTGECYTILTADDVSQPGDYHCQATVTFSDGTVFSSDIHTLYVAPKMKGSFVTSTYVPLDTNMIQVAVDGGEFL